MLRFDDIQIPPPKDPKKFELMLRDLYRAEWSDPFVQQHGRSGQGQHGVDLLALPHRAIRPFGVQAKEKNLQLGGKLTVKELRQEAQKARGFHPGLEVLILATTSARDAAIQRAALKLSLQNRRKKLFDVQICFWDDVCSMLEKHKHVAADYYPTLFRHPREREIDRRQLPGMDGPALLGRPVVITAELIKVAVLVVVAPGPVLASHFARIFSTKGFSGHVRRLVGLGYLRENDGFLTVPPAIARVLRKDKQFCTQQVAAWENALRPLEHHVDMAAYQAVLYMRTDRLERAVELLCDVAETIEPGAWNERYLHFLLPLDQHRLSRKLSPNTRVRFLNSLGLCHARAGNHREAINCFDRLLAESRRAKCSWGIGQALINKGVAFNAAEDDKNSKRFYERAASHGRRSGDDLLLGRSLHNLAQILINESPELAQECLRKSAAAKRRAKDLAGEVATILTQGLILSGTGKFQKAEELFKTAEKLARKNDQRYERAIALCNLGRVNLDMGRQRTAIGYYLRSEKLCAKERFRYPTDLALEGAAISQHQSGDAVSAIAIYRRLHEDKDSRYPLATRLRAGMQLTRIYSAENTPQAAWKVVFDLVSQSSPSSDFTVVLQAVSGLVANEGSRGNGKAALISLENLADRIMKTIPSLYPPLLEAGLAGWKCVSNEAEVARELLRKCNVGWKRLRNIDGQLRSMQLAANCAWELAEFEEATKILSAAHALARKQNCVAQEGLIAQQLAYCFQELSHYEAAEPLYRRAIEIGKSCRLSLLLRDATNNLGELLRRTERPREGIKWLIQSERLCLTDGLVDEAISVRHNRALALHAVGKKREAKALLRQIHRTAARLGNSYEVVRALHGLAILAEADSQPGVSIPLFRKALREAARRQEQDETILFNYSSALRRAGHSKEAAPLLQQSIDNWKLDPLHHRRMVDAALAWTEADNLSAAKRCWKAVIRHAKVAKDREYVAIASASLAELVEDRRQFKEAGHLLDQAIQYEPIAEDRVLLRLKQIELAIAANWKRKTETLYRKFTKEVQGHSEQYSLLVDLHMLLGDTSWKIARDRLKAVEAYTAAIAFATFALDAHMLGQVLAHVMDKLLFPEVPSAQECERFLRHSELWLSRQSSLQKVKWLHASLVGPFKVATRISREHISVPKLGGRGMQRLYEEEVFTKSF